MSKKEQANSETLPKSDKERKAKNKSSPDYKRRTFILNFCGVGIAFLSLTVAATVAYFNLSKQVSNVDNKVSEVGNRVENVEKNVLSSQFIIIAPHDGESVDSSAIIRGKTPYPERNHYIVITAIGTNEDWVQENLIKPDPNGNWAGSAKFGTGEVGKGQQFLVRALATSSMMQGGNSVPVPADAIPSESITVTRKK